MTGRQLVHAEATEAFRQEVRKWLPKALAEIAALGREPENYDRDQWERLQWDKLLYANGYAGLCWPVEYGGRGMEPAMEAVFAEECARAHASDGLNRIGLKLAGPAIMHAGTAAQKDRFLLPILQAEEIWCEGFSEPNAGSDLAAVGTRAHWNGEKWLISGSKIWTSFASVADRSYLLAKTSGTAPRHHNLTVFLFDMRQPGVTVRPLRKADGGTGFAEVFLSDAVASAGEVLGEVNGGWPLATVGSGGLRAAGVAIQIWHKYVRIREMIDQLADCGDETGQTATQIDSFRRQHELLRWHILRSGGMVPDAERMSAPAATQVAKLLWSGLFQSVADAGIAQNCPTHRDFWRQVYLEARPTTLYGGSVQLQRNIIADQVLRLRKRL